MQCYFNQNIANTYANNFILAVFLAKSDNNTLQVSENDDVSRKYQCSLCKSHGHTKPKCPLNQKNKQNTTSES